MGGVTTLSPSYGAEWSTSVSTLLKFQDTDPVASAVYYLPFYLGVCWMIIPFSPLVTSLQAIPSSVVGDSSQLPVREENGEVTLPFFWLDAYEDPLNQPGTVFLFGKVKLPNAKLYSRFVYSGTPPPLLHCGHP